YPGLDDKIRMERTYSGLKAGVERAYRSWRSERACAARATRQITDDMSLPTLLVQPHVVGIESLVTRHSVTGELTSSLNFTDSVHNSVASFSALHERLVRSVDLATRRPVKISFTSAIGREDVKI